MKFIAVVLLSFFLLLSMTACNTPGTDGSSTDPSASKPTPTTQPLSQPAHIQTVCSKDSVEEFMQIIGDMQGDGLLAGYDFSEKNCYNVTPPEVAAETGAEIFKFSDSFGSFVLVENEVYELCTSFGGFGFFNAVPCDLDNDGTTDLLVASSWGSGIHRSEISVFNLKTKESTILYSTLESNDPQIDLFVSREASSDGQDPYIVYSAQIEDIDFHTGQLTYMPVEMVGRIRTVDKEPVFVPEGMR